MKNLMVCLVFFGSLASQAALTQNFDVEVFSAFDKRTGSQLLEEKVDYLIQGQLLILDAAALNARLSARVGGDQKALCFGLGSLGHNITEVTFLVIGGQKHGLFSDRASRLARELYASQEELSFFCTGHESRKEPGSITKIEDVEGKIKSIKGQLEGLKSAI